MKGVVCLKLLIIICFSQAGSYVESTCCKDTYFHVVSRICCSLSVYRYALYNGFNTSGYVEPFHVWKFTQPLKLLDLPLDQITENYVRQVPGAIFSLVETTPFSSKPVLVAVSDEVLREILNIDPSSIENDDDFLAMVSGRRAVRGSTPVAHRYGGHQFGVWADQLGDGRAHLLGEYVNDRGQRWELQLKGSGKTPYSRQGDGRAVLRSSVREFLCSEAMYHLGIPTSRAASLVVSDDTVIRDRFYDGHPIQEKIAVVLRLAPSWFRIGSLEILAYKGETTLLKRLADFIIKEHYPDIDASDSNRYVGLFYKVVAGTAEMIARWQSVGFAHGVCNTDNFSLLSITIDYGPFGFLDAYDPEFVPNTSDDEHRYSFEKQPDVGYFNLKKLRLSLLPILNEKQKIQTEKILEMYADMYKSKFLSIYIQKLGLAGTEDGDELYLVAVLLKMMTDKKADFTMTFQELSEWHKDEIKVTKVDRSRFWALKTISSHPYFKNWCQLYLARIEKSGGSEKMRHSNMKKVNPRYILRNWMAEEAISAAEKGDFSALKMIQQILRNPFTKQTEAELTGYADPPPSWASSIRVSCSS